MIDFGNLIDKYLFRKFKPKGIGKYYPSECGNCMRKVWYSYKYPQELKPDLIRIFETGNILHDFVVEVLKSEKTSDVELLKWEFPFKISLEDFVISGRVDDLILVKASGKTILVEVKSCNFLKYIKSPKPHHVIQLQLYMHATGVHNGILLYIEKNTLENKLFTILYDEKMAKKALERFKQLHENLINSTLPDPEARINKSEIGWMCRLCDYMDRCFKDTPRIKSHK